VRATRVRAPRRFASSPSDPARAIRPERSSQSDPPSANSVAGFNGWVGSIHVLSTGRAANSNRNQFLVSCLTAGVHLSTPKNNSLFNSLICRHRYMK
jgi:hypothetical protein